MRSADIKVVNDVFDEVMFRLNHLQHKIGFWNAGYWKGIDGGLEHAQINLIETLVDFFINRNGNVLDVACGTGASSRFLTKYFDPKNVTGINISERQLEACKMIAPDCNFMLMDATNITFDESFFDNILCIESAMHFRTRRRFFEEAYRVLKPGGRMAMSDIIFGPTATKIFPFVFGENFLPSLEAYRDSLTDVGFSYVRVNDTTEFSVECLFREIERRFERDVDNILNKQDFEAMQKYAAAQPTCCMVYVVK